jgi:hypothetical protein
MTRRSSSRVLPLVAAAVAAAAAGIASAQVQLEEVTVTARKRAESLQEIPMSVTAFTAESIEARGIRNVQDVIDTPGLSFDKRLRAARHAPQHSRLADHPRPSAGGHAARWHRHFLRVDRDGRRQQPDEPQVGRRRAHRSRQRPAERAVWSRRVRWRHQLHL